MSKYPWIYKGVWTAETRDGEARVLAPALGLGQRGEYAAIITGPLFQDAEEFVKPAQDLLFAKGVGVTIMLGYNPELVEVARGRLVKPYGTHADGQVQHTIGRDEERFRFFAGINIFFIESTAHIMWYVCNRAALPEVRERGA